MTLPLLLAALSGLPDVEALTQPLPLVLDARFTATPLPGERSTTCEFAARVKKALSAPAAADGGVARGSLSGLPAAVDLDGPHGSGRYWTVTVGVTTAAGVVGTCLTTTTVGHRQASKVAAALGAWQPLVHDRFVLWTTMDLGADGFPSALLPLAFRLESFGVLAIDRRATADAVLQMAAAYDTCGGSDCASLKTASAAMKAWATAARAEPEPQTLEVPPALRAMTAPLELSGLRWVPALQRYLAVSDDTGFPDTESRAAPWLFTISADGKVDPRPLPLSGVEKVDDLESLTEGASPGEFFAVTSHSLTTKGKSKPARRQLLRLELRDGALSVKESLDLQALGLEQLAGGPLDVEAVAFRGGLVFLGLKAPLSADGRAQLFTLDLQTRTFARWDSVRLEVNGVGQGVTDLLFLPEGRAVLAANAPKGGPPDRGGALWLLEAPGKPPLLLQRFFGLKPEGLSLTPDGKRLRVVFDRGAAAPQWLEVPLP